MTPRRAAATAVLIGALTACGGAAEDDDDDLAPAPTSAAPSSAPAVTPSPSSSPAPTPAPTAPGAPTPTDALTTAFVGDACTALPAEAVAARFPDEPLPPIAHDVPETAPNAICSYGSLDGGSLVSLTLPNGQPQLTGGYSRFSTAGPFGACRDELARVETEVLGQSATTVLCGQDNVAIGVASPVDDRGAACLVVGLPLPAGEAEQFCREAFQRAVDLS